MRDVSSDGRSGGERSTPLVPLILWVVAVLAYPAFLLVRLAATPKLAETAVLCLPTVVGQSILRLPILLAAALVWAIAVGAGMALLRRTGFTSLSDGERAVFGGAVGMGVLSLGTFLAGTVSGHPPWLLRALLFALLGGMALFGWRDLFRGVAGLWRHVGTLRREASRSSLVLAGLAVVIVLIALARTNVPVVADYDSLEYHLAAPAQWAREGRVSFIRDVVYTNFPQNVEMLYLLAMSCFGGALSGAAVGLHVGIGFTLAAAAGIAACGRRLASPAAGRTGALIFLTAPMLIELATLNSYVVELPLTAYAFLALFAFLLWRRAEGPRQRWRYAVLCGVLIGLAVGCKYPALLFVLVPIVGFVLAVGVLRLASIRQAVGTAAVVGAVALAVASPWLIRNAVNTGNPTYPLLYSTFGGSSWTPEQEARFSRAHGAADGRFIGVGERFWKFALWRDQPANGWVPPAAALIPLFALVAVALADRRSATPVFYLAAVFLVVTGAVELAPQEMADQNGLAGVIGVAGLLAFFIYLGDRRNAQSALVMTVALLAIAVLLRVGPTRFILPLRIVNLLLAASVLALVTSPAFLLRKGDAVFLGVHCVLWLIAWHALTHRLDRFLDPATPAVAVLAGMGATSLTGLRPRRIGRGVLVGGLAAAAGMALLLSAPMLWAGLGQSPQAFLRHAFEGSTYCQPAIEAINKRLPTDATVLFLGESRTFYTRRRALAATVFDRHPIDRILAERGDEDPAQRVHDGLRKLGVTHLYVNWPEIGRLAASYAYRYGGREHHGVPDQAYGRLLGLMVNRPRPLLRLVAGFGARSHPDQPGRVFYDFAIYELAGVPDGST